MYYLFVLGKGLFLLLPRSFCYVVAKILAIAHFYLSPKDREALSYNLSPIVKEKRRLKKCVKEVFVNFSYYLVDFFRHSRVNQGFIKKYVKVSGENYIKHCLSENEGIILLTAHLGNYELGGAVISLIGYPPYVLALPHLNKRLDNFFNHQREITGVKIIPTGAKVKECFSLLRKGKIVVFLGDRNYGEGGLKVEMFSKYTYFPRGAAFFSLRTKAYIIPAFFVRKNRKFYHLIFEKPIVYKDEFSSEAKTEREILEEYVPTLEKYIKKYPEQWYMFQKYWL